MFSHLEEAARPYSDVRVQRYDHPITTSEEARIVGTKHNSSIVIWGSYLVNRSNALVTAHFDILESSHYLFLQTATRRLRVKVPELEHFEVQETLSSEISYLALLAMGVARYQRGDHEGAIVRFNEALRHSKVATNFISPAYLHTFRADCYLQLDKYSEAIRDLNTAISAGFRESYIYETMALSYFVNRELSRALHAVNQAISIDSTPESGHCLRALILVYLAEPAQALEELATTITQHPESAYVHQIRALVYVLQGDGDHALNALNTAEHLGAQPNELNDTFAYAYASKQNYTKALEYINKAIASAPNEDYYVFRAVLLTGLERDENASDEEASSDLNKAIGINPSFGPAYEHRGLLNWKLGDIDKASTDLGSAMSDLNNAISINPSYGPAYEHRGLLYWKLGDIDKASADLDTAIKVSPRIAGEYISRARLFAQKGIYESALRDLEMALRLEPMQVEAYFVRSRIFVEVGSLDRAKRDLTTILRISSDPEETDQARRQLDSLRDWNK
jgi:tetratricopeptide (TPR) repeat protein